MLRFRRVVVDAYCHGTLFLPAFITSHVRGAGLEIPQLPGLEKLLGEVGDGQSNHDTEHPL